LEIALENLENRSKQSPELTWDEELWIRLKWAKSLVIVDKTEFKLLIETADAEQLNELFFRDKPVEYAIEYCLQKPLKECSLKEVMDGLVLTFETTNWFDLVDYRDDGDYYTLIITSSLGFTLSKFTVTSIESALETYGVRAESVISTKMIFMKIFKISN
jgi:hypothetical protein